MKRGNMCPTCNYTGFKHYDGEYVGPEHPAVLNYVAKNKVICLVCGREEGYDGTVLDEGDSTKRVETPD